MNKLNIEAKEPWNPRNIQFSSNGSSSERYLGNLGEYQLLKDEDLNGYPVYQSLARNGRYIIYVGNKIILIINKT